MTIEDTREILNLRTDPEALARFVLLYYDTPRRLADLLYAVHKSMDAAFCEHSRNQIELAAFWVARSEPSTKEI